MPTYSYVCTDCGNKFDIVQAFSEESLTTCEQCQGKLRKIFNSVGVVFKGSGFYRTDSRSSTNSSTTASTIPAGNQNSSASSSPAKSTDSSSSSSSTESSSTSTTSTGNNSSAS